MVLKHGGNLTEAAQEFGIPTDQWLDLSTGINPFGYPVPQIPPQIWQRLPNGRDALIKASSRYYRCLPENILAIPGSQFAIQNLPALLPQTRIAIPAIGYQEHKAAWALNGHQIILYPPDQEDHVETLIRLGQVDVVLVINPNNPACTFLEKNRLLQWHRLLAARGGLLVVDEAFIDVSPEQSLAPHSGERGLILLRSFGKFFGLAGLRLGFMLADTTLCQKMAQQLGPWAINSPAEWIAEKALSNSEWHRETRRHLKKQSRRLFRFLSELFKNFAVDIKQTDFFVSLFMPSSMAAQIYQSLGQAGILTRLISIDKNRACIRIGLLPSPQDWTRFQQVTAQLLESPEETN